MFGFYFAVACVRYSHGVQETDEQFDARYVNYFNRPDIDGWEIRKAINDLQVDCLKITLYMVMYSLRKLDVNPLCYSNVCFF